MENQKVIPCSEFQNKTGTHPRFQSRAEIQRSTCAMQSALWCFQSDTFSIEDLDQCVKNRQVLYQFPGGHFSNGCSANPYDIWYLCESQLDTFQKALILLKSCLPVHSLIKWTSHGSHLNCYVLSQIAKIHGPIKLQCIHWWNRNVNTNPFHNHWSILTNFCFEMR